MYNKRGERLMSENVTQSTEEVGGKPIVGTRYYRYVGDRLIQIRLLRIKNDNCYVVESYGQRFNMTKTEFKTYTKLRPDGYISFSVANLEDGIKDVIVMFFRKQDMAQLIPFAVCRMNIYDMFTNVINKEDGILYIGCSVNQDSCPADIDFNLTRACNGTEKDDVIAVYIEDTLDSILHLVNSVPYDDVLYTLSAGYVPDKTRGVCSTLRELLEQNHFIDDVYYGFNELPVQFKYIPEVAGDLIHAVEDVIKHEMINPVWVKFDRDIDISKIKDKYLIIRDIEDNLFIVSYVEGEYVNRPYFAMGDTSELDLFKTVTQTNK